MDDPHDIVSELIETVHSLMKKEDRVGLYGSGQLPLMSMRDLQRVEVSDVSWACLHTYARVRDRHGKRMFPSRWRALLEDLQHSALIYWLALGNEPLPKPPPLCMSRPWHELIVAGYGHPFSVWVDKAGLCYQGAGGSKRRVSIEEDLAWHITRWRSDRDMTVQHDRWPELSWTLKTIGRREGWESESGLGLVWELKREG